MSVGAGDAMQDLYYWAKRRGLYIEQDVLAAWLRSEGERSVTVILDCRDDDHAGGHIAGSWHTPDGVFDAAAVLDRLVKAGARRVVLHCMESARRGPRCAHRLATTMDAMQGNVPSLDLHVLRGGADQWIRRFITEDPALVDAFDNDYWGWPGDGTAGPNPRAQGQLPEHALYERPADQPAPGPEGY